MMRGTTRRETRPGTRAARAQARAQKLLHRPHAVDREAQRRIRAHLFQQPIEVAVLQFLDFRLVIGKPDVEMVVRLGGRELVMFWGENEKTRIEGGWGAPTRGKISPGGGGPPFSGVAPPQR